MNVVVSEYDLAVPCDGCHSAAAYVVVLHAGETYRRLYCPECMTRLVEGVSKVLRDNDDSRGLHELVETEHLFTGREIVNV